jgi:hypothetical protein
MKETSIDRYEPFIAHHETAEMPEPGHCARSGKGLGRSRSDTASQGPPLAWGGAARAGPWHGSSPAPEDRRVRCALTPRAQWASPEGRLFRAAGQARSSRRRSARQGLPGPVPGEPQHALAGLLPPPLPPAGARVPPLAPAPPRAPLQLRVLPGLAHGAVRGGHPAGVDPAGQDGVAPLAEGGDGRCPALPPALAARRRHRQPSRLPRGQASGRVLPPVPGTPTIAAQRRERLPRARVDDAGLPRLHRPRPGRQGSGRGVRP